MWTKYVSAIKVGHKSKVHFLFMQKNSRFWAGTEEILPEEGQFLCGKVSSIHGFVNASICSIFQEGTLMAESEEELRSLLMKVREKCQEAGLNFNIQKTKIMASRPITSWEIEGETVAIVSDSILGAPKSRQMVIAVIKLKDTYSLEGKLWPN